MHLVLFISFSIVNIFVCLTLCFNVLVKIESFKIVMEIDFYFFYVMIREI